MIEKLEQQLDSFDSQQRSDALTQLKQLAEEGKVALGDSGWVNMHFHTFYSYNYRDYSPSKIAWLAKKHGLALAGTVDFDVLDAADEFHQACALLDLKGAVGLETRVFVKEFADREMNSPGEPGISYHMGVGFPGMELTGAARDFLTRLKQTARQRNVNVLERVNGFLSEVALDYEQDVLPLTPSGNATERHICLAYARQAAKRLGTGSELRDYWQEKLGSAELELPEGASLLNTLRAKTMKRGGVGYVQPTAESFPSLEETNAFILAAGAMPTQTWLNGMSAGEQAMAELFDVGMATGVTALNIVPDRNYTPGVKDEKLANLYAVVELARKLDLPIVAGTEMNSPGLKFVDAFDTAELKPLLPEFLRGAYIVYAHSMLQRSCGLGYTSDWAAEHFPSRRERNAFYEKLGQRVRVNQLELLQSCDGNSGPADVMKTIEA